MDVHTWLLFEMLEDDDEDDDMLVLHALTGVVVSGIEERRAIKARIRNLNRAYIVRGDLLRNPRSATPRIHLYTHGSNRAFIVTMGIDCNTFNYLLESGFERLWNSNPIPRKEAVLGATPCPHRRSLDAAGGLGLALHWLSSTMTEYTLQTLFALIPSTVTRYIHFALKILTHVLQNSVPEAQINWPSTGDEFWHYSKLICTKYSLLWGAFGFMDGLKLPLKVSSDPIWENATYNGWLHDHFISNVLVQSPEGMYLLYMIMHNS
jgi:hypothetical protein